MPVGEPIRGWRRCQPAERWSMELHPSDVLIFVKSSRVVSLVTPPDAQNEVMAALESHGYCTFGVGAGSWGGHATGGGSAFFDGGHFGNKPVFEEELPEDQANAIRLVYRKVQAAGRTLHLVDVGRESAARRLIQEHLKHLQHFPVLIRPDGRRLEGPQSFTEAALDAFLKD
jgi:hypothetical protein